MTNIISVENLSKTFRISQKDPGFLERIKSLVRPKFRIINAVDKISFSVNEGELVAFIGPNGAGKSTTIKMMTGILYPTSGNLQILGLNPLEQREKLAYQIGSVFGQKPQLWYHLPAADTFQLYQRIYELNKSDFNQRLDFLTEAFEIKDLLNIPVRKLSLGQRMRCEIVASLLHKPKIIFLDEPTIGLDVIAKQRIREIIKYLNETEKVTIFLTSHDAGDVETLAKRTIVINHGRILFDDTTEQFKRNYIKTKNVELVVDGRTSDFNFPEARVIEKTSVSIKVEIPSESNLIEKLLAYAVENFKIQDINIVEPPMEKIIAGIYKQKNV